MRIIKLGDNVPIDSPHPIICKSCRSELEYTRADTKYNVMGDSYVVCPVCRQCLLLKDD
jgi:hypothetical protein